LANG